MSELISGKDVFIALAKGEDVQVHESTYKKDVWFNLIETNFNTGEILSGNVDNKPYTLKFRLKPRTIILNGIEVPAPFKPKEGERYFYIYPSADAGYGSATTIKLSKYLQFGAWRTEEEIKQVVKALRSIFK